MEQNKTDKDERRIYFFLRGYGTLQKRNKVLFQGERIPVVSQNNLTFKKTDNCGIYNSIFSNNNDCWVGSFLK